MLQHHQMRLHPATVLCRLTAIAVAVSIPSDAQSQAVRGRCSELLGLIAATADSVARTSNAEIDPAHTTLADLRRLLGSNGDTALVRTVRNTVTVNWFFGTSLRELEHCRRNPSAASFTDLRLVKATFVLVPADTVLANDAIPWIVQFNYASPQVPASIMGVRVTDTVSGLREHARQLGATFDSARGNIRLSPTLSLNWTENDGHIWRLWSSFGAWSVSP